MDLGPKAAQRLLLVCLLLAARVLCANIDGIVDAKRAFARSTRRVTQFIQESMMASYDPIVTDSSTKMRAAMRALLDDFDLIITGYITNKTFSKINADCYGTPTPITQLASIACTSAEPNKATVTPGITDLLNNIVAALQSVFPSTAVKPLPPKIQIYIPRMSLADMSSIAKRIQDRGEVGRSALRKVRYEALEALKAPAYELDYGAGSAAIEGLFSDFLAEMDRQIAQKDGELNWTR